MKRLLAGFLAMAFLVVSLGGCAGGKESILILSSMEDFRNANAQKMLNEKFPDYEIQLQYMSTGNHAAKLKAEGVSTECDIALGLEITYLKQNASILANLSSVDSSAFLEDLLPADNTYLPWERSSGCIALREDLLLDKGLPVPTSYADLLNPVYKGLISMPSPKASGTGYVFLQSLVNAWGEEAALTYFDALAENVLQFTSSGSGPVNALVQGEVAIGLGMTFQAVEEQNKGTALTIKYFAEGAPFSLCGAAIVKGKEAKAGVKEVFAYLMTDVVKSDKEQFVPEQILKEQTNKIANYPQSIPYADMHSENPVETKEALLEKWTH